MSAASNRDPLPLIACGGARSHSGRGRGSSWRICSSANPRVKALRGVDWQAERQTLVAKRGDHPGAFIEGGFGCLGFAPGGQRVCASAQVIGCAFRGTILTRLNEGVVSKRPVAGESGIRDLERK
jgi:hypothetical protein